MAINQRIKDLRNQNGLTQKELAKKVNVSPQVISNWERNYTAPDHEDVLRLAEALNTTPNDLLGKTEKSSLNTDEEFDSLAAIKEIVEELGIKDLFFHNIDDLKNLTKEDVEDIRRDFEYTLRKARRRKERED